MFSSAEAFGGDQPGVGGQREKTTIDLADI
jgi:hypothetical protein